MRYSELLFYQNLNPNGRLVGKFRRTVQPGRNIERHSTTLHSSHLITTASICKGRNFWMPCANRW
jgi:hypothetical protein